MRLDLPDGNWATLREKEAVSERLRRTLAEAQYRLAKSMRLRDDDGSTEEGVSVTTETGDKVRVDPAAMEASMEKYQDVKDALIMCHLAAWSYDLPIQMVSLLDIPAVSYDALHDECAKLSKDNVVESGPEQAADPESPIAPLAE